MTKDSIVRPGSIPRALGIPLNFVVIFIPSCSADKFPKVLFLAAPVVLVAFSPSPLDGLNFSS